MSKFKIDIFIESRYPADRENLRQAARTVLRENKVKGDVELGVAIVGDRKMRQLNREYRDKKGTTPVLAFSMQEAAKSGYFPTPQDDVLRLGDVIISYPQARALAREEEKLVDEVLGELVGHGVSKLLGD